MAKPDSLRNRELEFNQIKHFAVCQMPTLFSSRFSETFKSLRLYSHCSSNVKEVKTWHKVNITYTSTQVTESNDAFGADVSAVVVSWLFFFFRKMQQSLFVCYWLFWLWKLTLTTDQLETENIAHYALLSFNANESEEKTADTLEKISRRLSFQ